MLQLKPISFIMNQQRKKIPSTFIHLLMICSIMTFDFPNFAHCPFSPPDILNQNSVKWKHKLILLYIFHSFLLFFPYKKEHQNYTESIVRWLLCINIFIRIIILDFFFKSILYFRVLITVIHTFKTANISLVTVYHLHL